MDWFKGMSPRQRGRAEQITINTLIMAFIIISMVMFRTAQMTTILSVFVGWTIGLLIAFWSARRGDEP